MKPLVVDTGPLVALINARDASHAVCAAVVAARNGRMVTTWPVITEAAWLLRQDLRAVDHLMRMLTTRFVDLYTLDRDAAIWIRRFLERYHDLGPQVADASLVYVAERLDLTEVFTLGRRDFAVFRREDGRPLRLFPA